jgi:GNAT superfamily N-acetyltransferase
MRSLDHGDWPVAMTLAARCFLGEPFVVEMFGAEPLQRFASAHEFYQSSPWHDDDVHFGAFVDGVLVGLCLISPYGRCHICAHVDPERPPANRLALVDWEFELNVKAAHADQGAHAWLSRLMVDPALRGAGIGRTLIGDAVAHLRADGAGALLLECQPHREPLYVAAGFARVRTFRDPVGPDASLMRMDLAPSG